MSTFAGVAAFIARYDALAAEIALLCESKYAALGAEQVSADALLAEVQDVTALVADASVHLADVDVIAHAQSLADRIQRAGALLDATGATGGAGDTYPALLDSHSLRLSADPSRILDDISRLGRLS